MGRQHLLVDGGGVQLAGGGLAGQGLGRPDDLLAAAVVHRHIQHHAGAVGGALFDLVHQLLVAGLQGGAVAQKDDLVVAAFVVKGADQVLPQQFHDGAHLFGGALPVLGGKGIEVHRRQPQLVAVVGDLLEHLGPFFVAGGAGQAPLFGPAAVAVHDDAHRKPLGKVFRMLRHNVPPRRWRALYRKKCRAPPSTRHLPFVCGDPCGRLRPT